MPSLIPGYNYDIFISYRQKDNKYDGWVTEFVDNLKKELEATFKDEISVYFDINPHDGLLETHDVDESLKEKLKCLVFIPIISRTYCDPKSFAWEHEFKAFVDSASKDQFGLKIRLPNGNVANRVLPIRIYDLDNADIKLCESVLGSVLRGVEFIYSEPGVNRPLKPDDDEKINLNKTKYRNQINKVGNAIKEIIQGLSSEPVKEEKEKDQLKEPFKEVWEEERRINLEKPAKASKRKFLIPIAIAVIFIIAGIFAYPRIFKRDTLERLRSSGERISVAVMPFQNMTNDTIWNVWQDVIQDNLINFLSNYTEELQVRQSESISSMLQSKDLTDNASITPSLARAISQKLNADIFVYGSLSKAGNTLRINAKLIDSKTEEVFKSFQIEGSSEEKNIFPFIDSLSLEIKNFLVISELRKKESLDIQYATTNSPEAYSYFIQGKNAFGESDYPSAIEMLSQAITVDSNFTMATVWLSAAYYRQGLYEQGKMWCIRFYSTRDRMSVMERLWTNYNYAKYFETPHETIMCLRQIQEIDDQLPILYFLLGYEYNAFHQYNKAIPEFEKALEIYHNWGTKPFFSAYNYIGPGRAYHKEGKYKKEKKLYKKAERDFHDDPELIYRQAILSFTVGDMLAANEYIKKYISLRKERSASEATISTNLAGIYSEANLADKAEEYYRQALSLEPENLGRMNSLAYFLINKDRNITDGMELIDKVLELSPENYNYLHTKGWGLYKQVKYQEAKDVLQKSWDLRMKNAIYDHEAYLHLEAAKKAVAEQKRTER